MRFLLLVVVLANSSYFVEWIPNNNAAAPATSTIVSGSTHNPGEWPWQL